MEKFFIVSGILILSCFGILGYSIFNQIKEESSDTTFIESNDIGLVFERNNKTTVLTYESIRSIEESDENKFSSFKGKYDVKLESGVFEQVMRVNLLKQKDVSD